MKTIRPSKLRYLYSSSSCDCMTMLTSKHLKASNIRCRDQSQWSPWQLPQQHHAPRSSNHSFPPLYEYPRAVFINFYQSSSSSQRRELFIAGGGSSGFCPAAFASSVGEGPTSHAFSLALSVVVAGSCSIPVRRLWTETTAQRR